MGLKNGQQIFSGLQKVSPKAFMSRVYPDYGYKTFAVDLMSLMHSLMTHCRTGHDVLRRLKLMFEQHKKCSKKKLLAPGEIENKMVVSIIALEDYSETPKNKEIERASRIEADTSVSYADKIELWTAGEESEGTVVDAASYTFESLDTFLPKNFSSVRSTPALMRKLIRFLCKIIDENIATLTNNDPNHVIVVDGFRDYKTLTLNDNENIGGSEAAKKIGIWRSDTREISEKSTIGEAEVKAVNWAINYNQFGSVLVHANDGDILMLLAIYSLRKPFVNLVTGVMSTSYLFPLHDGKAAETDGETKKVFCPGTLAIDVYDHINKVNESGVVLPQTYFLFLMMCGNDYVESLPGIGPAKLMNILATRRPGLLDKAVTFVMSEERVSIEVDEKAILDTLVLKYSTLLHKENISPEYLAAWIRRIFWTLDYNINEPLGNKRLDPCARKDGLSLYGYQLNEYGRCVIDNDVYEPTLVQLQVASKEIVKKRTIKHTGEILDAHILDGPQKKKAKQNPLPPPSTSSTKPEVFVPVREPENHMDEINDDFRKKKEILFGSESDVGSTTNFHDFLASKVFPKSMREENIAQMRNPIPFGKISK